MATEQEETELRQNCAENSKNNKKGPQKVKHTHFDDRAALLALLAALFRFALVRVDNGNARQPFVRGLVLLLRHGWRVCVCVSVTCV
jgi:hypothetical protein